jgi:hypothetical protein
VNIHFCMFMVVLSLFAFDARAFDMNVIKDELPAPIVEVEPDDFYGSKEKLLKNAANGSLYNHMYIGFDKSGKFEDEFPHQLYGILSNDYGMKIDFSQYRRNREVPWCSAFVNQKISQVIFSLSKATFYNKFEPGVSFKNQVIPSWMESPYKFLDEIENKETKERLMAGFQGSYSNVVESCSQSDDGKRFLAAFRQFLQDLGGAMDGYVKVQYELMVAERDEVESAKIAKERESRVQQDRMKQCFSGNAYKLHAASQLVVDQNSKIANAKRQLAKQNEIGRISGSVNLSEKNRLGTILVDSESLRGKFFSDYKRYGGSAVSPEKVLVLDNPCRN